MLLYDLLMATDQTPLLSPLTLPLQSCIYYKSILPNSVQNLIWQIQLYSLWKYWWVNCLFTFWIISWLSPRTNPRSRRKHVGLYRRLFTLYYLIDEFLLELEVGHIEMLQVEALLHAVDWNNCEGTIAENGPTVVGGEVVDEWALELLSLEDGFGLVGIAI